MGKKPRFIEVDGMILPPDFLPEVYRAAVNFKPDKDDVVVVTYPKCGTTWVTQIVALIMRNGEPLMTAEEYFDFLPFLEATMTDQLTRMARPRLIKTHLPFDRLNFNPETKYIYVARHPADCLVSHYHHMRFFHTYFFTGGTLEDYFELFIKGELEYNDFFTHLLSGYEKRNEPNVLFLTYESMMCDHKGACLKIARFLGDRYYENLTEKDEAVLKKVLEYSSLDFMKSTVNDFMKKQFASFATEEEQEANPVLKRVAEVLQEALQSGEKSEGNFIRKGVVGEGKNNLTTKQKQKLNDRIKEKTANSDVMNLWEQA